MKIRAVPKVENHKEQEADSKPLRLLKRREVEEKTSMSCSAIYAAISAGTFPKPCAIGARAVAWLESEVDAWIAERLASRKVAA